MRNYCTVPECRRVVHGHGLCIKHYTRQRENGSPTVSRRASNGDPEEWIAAHADYPYDWCLIWPFGRAADGRGLLNSPDGRSMSVGRAMCTEAHGEPPFLDAEAAHSCGRGNQGCANPRHLRWATSVENAADKEAHGTAPRGENNGRRKLGTEEVLAIRKDNRPYREIAKTYGICSSNVSMIKSGKSWAHL